MTTQTADRRIPEWLEPHKSKYLTTLEMRKLMDLEVGKFRPWLELVKPRLECIRDTKPDGTIIQRFKVKHVWAVARAHGLMLRQTRDFETPAGLLRELEAASLKTREMHLELKRAQQEADRLRADIRAGENQARMIRRLALSTEPKRLPGVYFLLATDGAVVYVGQSKNVLSRMQGHATKEFSSVKMIHVEEEAERLEVEAYLISVLLPKMNSQHMPSYLRAKAAQA